MRFQGKTALVTGGAGAIGFACAQRLARDGARVALLDLDAADPGGAARRLNDAGAEAIGLACDVADAAAVEQAYHRVQADFGPIQHIVSVAGQMIYRPIENIEPEDWSRLLGVNFLSAAWLTRLAFQHMPAGGSLVFVSSIHAWQTSALVGPYAAAKAALNSLARTAAIEGEAKSLRVNCVAPGAIDTPMLRDSPNIKAGIEVLRPQDVGTPDDVAAAVAFLLSDEARFITGDCLRVDGGRLARL